MTEAVRISETLRPDVKRKWFKVHIPDTMKQPRILKKHGCTFYIWFPKKLRPLHRKKNVLATAAILGIIDSDENYLSMTFNYYPNVGNSWQRVKYVLQSYRPGLQPCHDLRDVARTVRVVIDWIIDGYQAKFSRTRARQRGEGPQAPGGN